MWKHSLLVGVLVAGAGMALTVPAWAQDEDREKCECQAPWADVRAFGQGQGPLTWLNARRARLGVMVQGRANPETDTIGALIERVLPGSPADEAGLRDGDIITKLDGRSLLTGDEDYDEDEPPPARRLVERARRLEAGDTVEVEYRRDDATRTTSVVAGGREGSYVVYPEAPAMPLQLRQLTERLEHLPRAMSVGFPAGLPGLELSELNEGLSEYFGTEKGVLVLDVPEESELGLRPGDVIQKIDGRDVRSPGHVERILRSYDPDEEITFEIVRQKRTTTVTGHVPERWDRSRMLELYRDGRER